MTETKGGKKLIAGLQGGLTKFVGNVEKKISDVSGVNMAKVVAEEKIESLLPEKSKEKEVEKEGKKGKVGLKKTFSKVVGGVSGFLDKVEKKISEVSGSDLDSLVKLPKKENENDNLEGKTQ